MKILFLNGSPKISGSSSEKLIKDLCQKLGDSNEYIMSNAVRESAQIFLEKIRDVNALIIVFPFYGDGLPSHLLRLLYEVKDKIKHSSSEIMVYAIANNGFYEGEQNRLALSMLQHFCVCAGIKWGQGIGIGAGGLISSANVSIGVGPLKNIGLAFDVLSKNIQEKVVDEDFFIRPNFPKFLYKITAHREMKSKVKKSGLGRKEILKRH